MLYGQGVFVFQFIVTMACVAFSLAAGLQRSNRLSKLLLVVAMFCAIANMGYLMELQATQTESVLLTMKLRYVGVAFVETFFLLFCIRYTGHRLAPMWRGVLLSIDIIVMFMAWTCEFHNLFYRDYYFVSVGERMYFHREYGPVVYFNFCYNAVLMLVSAALAIQGWRSSYDGKYRRSCKMMCLCVLLPFLIIPIRLAKLDLGYELMPSLTAIGMILFFLSAVAQDMFDISRVAHSNIFETMREPIVIVDGDYGFVEANARAKEIFPSLKKCRTGEIMQETKLMTYLRTGINNKLYHQDQVYDVHIDQIYEEGVLMGYSILLTDLTDEERQMNRIQALVSAANEANQAKSDFLASMSHELRTPINSIMGMNEMIIRETKEKQTSQYARDVESAASMLLSLVNDILDTSKIAAGKFNILPVRYDLGDMLCELYKMMQPHAARKGLSFDFQVDASLPRGYIGDDVRIRQVLINLISNAIKYTQSGGVIVRVTQVPMTEAEGINLHFLVKDTGDGILPEDIPMIYARFDRMEDEKIHHIEGTGLGLNVSASILELMNSKLDVWSQEGVGSDFSFMLHQNVADSHPIGDFCLALNVSEDEESFVSSFYAPDAKILVVDDNDMNRRVFVELLKESKLRIDEAAGGRECLELTKKQRYDLIFLDHMMPDMDGIETLKELQKDIKNPCHDVPVIMLTANVIAGSREKYLSEGFWDFLAKPIVYDKLEELITKYLPEDMVKHTKQRAGGKQELELPEMEEFDYAYAGLIWKNKESLKGALQEFATEISAMKERIIEASQQQDWETYRREVHTLKGASASVGAILLSKTARLVEIALQREEAEQLLSLQEILIQEIELHEERLQEHFGEKKEMIAETGQNLLMMLENAIENQDIGAMDFLYEQLKELAWSREALRIVNSLGKHLTALQMEEAAGEVEILRTFC